MRPLASCLSGYTSKPLCSEVFPETMGQILRAEKRERKCVCESGAAKGISSIQSLITPGLHNTQFCMSLLNPHPWMCLLPALTTSAASGYFSELPTPLDPAVSKSPALLPVSKAPPTQHIFFPLLLSPYSLQAKG